MPDGLWRVSTVALELVKAHRADHGLWLVLDPTPELDHPVIGHVDAMVPVDTESQNPEVIAALEPRHHSCTAVSFNSIARR